MKYLKELGLIVLGGAIVYGIIFNMTLNIRISNLEKAHNNLVKALSQTKPETK